MGRYRDMFENRIKNLNHIVSVVSVAVEVLNVVDEDVAREEQAYRSRFYEIVRDGANLPMCIPVTEDSISYDYDTADCHGEDVGPYFYLEDDGKLYPVTCGRMVRDQGADDIDPPFIFAHSNLIANGKVVGQVSHTDH